MENARFMDPEMFRAEWVDWTEFEPYHLLALRACVPNTPVFTADAKRDYVIRTTGTELAKLADTLFSRRDYEFITELPGAYQPYRDQLLSLMQLAYRKGVRNPDTRVRAM